MMVMGRPKLPDGKARNKVRSVHFADDEIETVEAAAKRAGLPVTRYIRERAVAAAKRSR
jgi:hypothetical protein